MQAIIGQIVASDMLVLASPVRFGSYCAELKKVVDRSQPLMVPIYVVRAGEMHFEGRYELPSLLWVGPVREAAGHAGATELAVAVTDADGGDGTYPIDLAFSPVSPLILGGDVSDALVEQVRRGGVVVEILPCPAAATTAPGAISAALAQQHAEVLAGVVLAQAAAPGTPVYYGPRLSAVDPRSGIVVSGTPEAGVASVAAVLLARRCGLACDCYGPCSGSKVLDTQFGFESGVNALLGLSAKPRLLSGIGEIQAGVASCLEVLVVDDEALNNVRYATTPRRYIRSEFVSPLLSYRGGLGDWLASGRGGLVGLIDRCASELGVGEHPDPHRVLGL